MRKKNILIRFDFVIYNTKNLYQKKIVKIPTYIMQDVIEGNKRILIKLNETNIALYNTEDLKKHLVTVESRVYNGRFKNQNIKYNLAQVAVDLSKIR